METHGGELFERWASLGISVGGKINPLEDPEELLVESLEHLEDEQRLLGAVATWIWGYGHLLNSKKLKFRSDRGRRIFSALLEMSERKEKKLRRLIQNKKKKEPEILIQTLTPTLQAWSRKNPDPFFLKQGLVLKQHTLIRPKILLEPNVVYRRSKILRNRALYGASLRSDVLTVLPTLKEVSIRELSRQLHVSAPSLDPIVRDLAHAGFVEWLTRSGREAKLKWRDLAAA